MSGKGGCQDNDKGMANIRKQIAALSNLGIKAGIVEGAGSKDGVSIAEYAAYNEYGVPGKTKKWRIPPRPFIRGWIENNSSEIKATQERLFKQVSEGKISAETAIARLGQFAQDGIKRYITEGGFDQNADATVMRKTRGKGGKTTPLIDTGTMRNSVRYKVIRGGKK